MTVRVPAEKLGAFEEKLALLERGQARVVELLMGPEQILALLPVIRSHPGVRFVLDHMPGCTVDGGPQSGETLEFLAAAAAPENVFLKVSSFVTKSALRPAPEDSGYFASAFSACYNAFGAERCIYGSDWPVLLLKGGYAGAVRVLTDWLRPLGGTVEEKVMGGNCARVYGADTEGL